MDKYDVLLTHKEQNTIYNLLHSQGGEHTNRELADANCKAQSLKLLEWLNKPCNIKQHHVCEDTLGWPRQDCRYCMSELESKLKEVSNG